MNDHSSPTPEDLAAEFPMRRDWTYLNHAAVSPWPTSTRRAVEAFAAANHREGPASFPDWLENERTLRERAARLLGASSGADISLLPNTTEGINLVAAGLDWRPGDNLVTAEGEFPSNRMPWAALSERGVSLRVVDLRAGEEPETALIGAMDERTRLVAVSSVQWNDGLRLRLGDVGAACRDAGALFFVDAIQQAGALRLHVVEDRVDCLAAGAHKWQMGPEGIGLFFCAPAWRERLEPLKRGWRMLERPFAFDERECPVAADGRRFESGSPNTLGQMALNASLGVQEGWGRDWIEARILANTERLMAGLDGLPGLRLASDPAPERRSGIVAFAPRARPARELVRELAKRGALTVARGELVRLSPHCYQGRAETERVLEWVENLINT